MGRTSQNNHKTIVTAQNEMLLQKSAKLFNSTGLDPQVYEKQTEQELTNNFNKSISSEVLIIPFNNLKELENLKPDSLIFLDIPDYLFANAPNKLFECSTYNLLLENSFEEKLFNALLFENCPALPQLRQSAETKLPSKTYDTIKNYLNKITAKKESIESLQATQIKKLEKQISKLVDSAISFAGAFNDSKNDTDLPFDNNGEIEIKLKLKEDQVRKILGDQN